MHQMKIPEATDMFKLEELRDRIDKFHEASPREKVMILCDKEYQLQAEEDDIIFVPSIEIIHGYVGAHCQIKFSDQDRSGRRPYAYSIDIRVNNLSTVVVHSFIEKDGEVQSDKTTGKPLRITENFRPQKLTINDTIIYDVPRREFGGK